MPEQKYTPRNELYPSPAAMAAATRCTEEIFKDLYRFACFIDDIAIETRTNERNRIFNMSPWQVIQLFWSSRSLTKKVVDKHSD